jgi:hypothetical protein
MKSVYIDAIPVRPLPKELEDRVGCVHCRARPARWELAQGKELAWSYSCSLCFLYEIPSLVEQSAAVANLIALVERQRAVTFIKDAEGHLQDAADADRVVSGIVIADRYMTARARSPRVET